MVKIPWYKSKTLWLAVLQAIASLLGTLSTSPEFQTLGWLGIVKSLVDIYLRTNTDRAIK